MRHFVPIQLAFLKADKKYSGFTTVKKFIKRLHAFNINLKANVLKFLIMTMYEKTRSDDLIDFDA